LTAVLILTVASRPRSLMLSITGWISIGVKERLEVSTSSLAM
jgi:hypothetical protein